jgi:uncharacterized protein (DUF1330 family)
MNVRYTVIAAAVAGFAAGALAIEQLHAQAKPPVFYVAEISMKNADAYQQEYAPKAQALIKKMGGKTLAAGSNITAIEGAPPSSRVAVQQWESIEAIQKWRDSAEYKQIRQIGDQYATFRSYAVQGLPQP